MVHVTTTAELAPIRTTDSAPASPTGELRALTGLRIVAAAWVVVFHFHFTALPGVALVVAALGPVITAGALGVDLFFVLSGFVIAYTYLEKLGPKLTAEATGRFVWARACRIWPAYALVFHMFGIWLLARAVYGVDSDIAFQSVQPVLSPGEWVEQLFMVQLWDQPYFDGASWVGSTWSISAEWLAYLLFPLVATVFYRMRNLPFTVLAGGAVALMTPIALAYLETGSPYYPWSWLVRILCGFGGGILAYLAVRKLKSQGTDVRRRASLVASATPVLIVVGLVVGELIGPGRGGAVILLFPILVGALALADRGVARFLSRPAMVHGGRISYALYLIHIPMFEVYWLAMAYVPELTGSTVVAHLAGLAVLGATLPAAQLLYRWVEEPARRAMKKVPAQLHGMDTPRPVVPLPTFCRGPLTSPLAVVPLDDRLPLGIPLDTDVARRDPCTAELPALETPLVAEKAIGLRGAAWPTRVAVQRAPIPNEVARRDPETHALPLVASLPQAPEVLDLPDFDDPWFARPRPAQQDRRSGAPGDARPRPDRLLPGSGAPGPAPSRPARPAPVPAPPADAAAEVVPAGAPMLPVISPLPVPRPVDRVQAARGAEVRSPHPELAEKLVAAGLNRGRHRARNARPHAAPHIAGQRGPERR